MPQRLDAETDVQAPGGVSRRRFLTYLVAAPTLTIGGRWLNETAVAPAEAAVPGPAVSDLFDQTDAFAMASAPTMSKLRLEVTEDNRAVFELPRMELGQGITTAVAMMIAEELEFPLDRVDVTLSPARPDLLFNQFTAGSSNVRTFYQPVSRMAAAARERIRQAAATRWGVPISSVRTEQGMVRAAGGPEASYGSLSQIAAALSLPLTPTPKPVSQHKLLGTRQTRIDARDIVTGRKRFTPDVLVAGAVPAVAVHAPTLMGTLRSIDNLGELRALPGVIDVVPVTAVPQFAYHTSPVSGATTIVIVAETLGQALVAEKTVRATWNAGPADGMSDADFWARLREASLPVLVPRSDQSTVDGEFEFAHLAHASMETQGAVADVRNGRAEVWAGLQAPIPAKRDVAAALGLSLDAVTVHVVPSGGGFGGRAYHEVVLEAVLASKAVGRPVRLTWSRPQDTKHDRLRPPTFHRIRATHVGGSVISFEHRFTSGYTTHSYGLGDLLTSVGANDPIGNATVGQSIFRLMMPAPYNLGVTTQTLSEVDFKIPRNAGAWRTIYTGTARTAEEIMVDEIAHALGQDPVTFRLSTLKSDRVKRCLQWVADQGAWGRSMPRGTAQGVGINYEHHSASACLVEIDATKRGHPRVTKAVIAYHAGLVINPSGLENQMLGGLNDAISSVLQAGIHIDRGAVREASFSDFRMARQANWPTDVLLHVFPASDGDEPGGAGESSLPAAAGAIANAYARATGTKPRRFPINH